MEKQLEFILYTKDDGVVVAASHLINSAHWNGELWYFQEEKQVLDNELIVDSSDVVKYTVPGSITDGVLLSASEVKVLVAADSGSLSIYSISSHEESHDDETVISNNLSINNDISRTEHDHSVLSVSANSNQKAVTGGMDCGIIVWDIDRFAPETTYEAAHIHHVTSVRFSGCSSAGDGSDSNNDIFVSTSLDGYCLLWDRREKLPAKVLCRYENSGLTSVEWLNNSLHDLVLGCEDGVLMSIDARNPNTPVYSYSAFLRPTNRICSHRFNSQNYVAVSANCRQLKVLRCDTNSFAEIYNNEIHKDYVKGLAWMQKNDGLLACGWDSRITKHYPFGSM